MLSRFNCLVLLSIMTMCTLPCFSDSTQKPIPSKPSKATPRDPNQADPGMPMTMPMVAPFFVQDSEYQSMVTMVNEIASTVHATLIVRSMDGTELGRKVIAFPPHSRIVQNLSSVLGADTPQRIMGSIELDPNPAEVTSMGIAAQLSATRATIPAASLEEEFLMVDMSMPSTFRAVIPFTFRSASVALFNTGDMPEHATVSCSTETGANFSTVVALAPHQMVFNPACDQTAEQNTLAIDQDPANPRNSKSAAAISVTTDGMPGSLAVWGMAQLGEGNGPIALNFTNSSALKTAETIFAGVPIGSADPLPGHSFKPALAVANFSGSPKNVTVTYNTMLGNAPNAAPVSTLQLPPMSVQHVSLSDLAGDPGLRNSFVITSDGLPGDVVSNLIILGGEGMQPVQLLGKDSQVSNGGGHPWNIDDGDRATVFLFNRSTKKELFNLNIVANKTRWHQEYTLKPGETKSVDIHKIVADQEADKKGNKLPANATGGEVSWFTIDPGKGSGRVLISNPQSGLARNFSCGYNLVLCGSYLYNSVATFGVGDDGYLGEINDYTCTAWANNACSGQQYDSGNGGYSYSWYSNNPGIAPTTGSTTNSSGTFYGQAIGTGYGTGELSSYYCQSSSTGTNNVTPQLQGQVTSQVPYEANSIIAAQLFTMTVNAVDQSGNMVTSVSGQATVQFSDVGIPGESASGTVTLNSGTGTINLQLNGVQNLNNGRAFSITPASGTQAAGSSGSVYVWFNAIASDEGLVGGTTAYGHVIQPNDHFVALPSNSGVDDALIRLRNGANLETTNVLDVGPWYPHSQSTQGNPCVGPNDPYWNTSGIARAETAACAVDHAGIDLADGTFADLGLVGNGRILWRWN